MKKIIIITAVFMGLLSYYFSSYAMEENVQCDGCYNHHKCIRQCSRCKNFVANEPYIYNIDTETCRQCEHRDEFKKAALENKPKPIITKLFTINEQSRIGYRDANHINKFDLMFFTKIDKNMPVRHPRTKRWLDGLGRLKDDYN